MERQTDRPKLAKLLDFLTAFLARMGWQVETGSEEEGGWGLDTDGIGGSVRRKI